MKKNLILFSTITLSAIISLTSCKKEIEGCTDVTANNYDKDADEDDGSCIYDYQYSFKNQTAQGKINGKSWEMKSGNAELGFFDSTELDIEFYDTDTVGACDFFIYEGPRLIGFIPNKTGVQEFSFDFTLNSKTVTLVYYESGDDIPNNVIISQGAIEFTSIGDSLVEGRIDAYSDDNNYINGNFTLTRCD